MASQDFGEATYVVGRHRKNPVLMYTSRTDRNKVYEFMIACRYKIPGLVSWKCVSCSKVKNGYRNLGAELKRKVPLILVDNDIIKEDPEKPLNAEHFCNGKDAVDAVLDRARLEFVHRHGNEEANSSKMRETIHHFAREAAACAPIPLNLKEKRQVQRQLDAKCLPLLHGVNKRRRNKRNKEIKGSVSVEKGFPHNAAELPERRNMPSSSDHHPHEHPEAIFPINRQAGGIKYDPEVTDTPRKKARTNKQAPQYPVSSQPRPVRPIPPYTYRQPAPSDVHQPYHTTAHPEQIEYYEEIIEEIEPVFNSDDLISGDQQQVAYSIEL
ncbi:hypothetical protein CRE_05390 [Caenorhabditis remanei]|uniref:Uncharacterized protein n=1 Tax=Caenorhabditis remanei TaxID=31234 RepID=E3M0A9_CAERE|nr:hypothetical protein CRE_05390 [Caenorhabditis remanei]